MAHEKSWPHACKKSPKGHHVDFLRSSYDVWQVLKRPCRLLLQNPAVDFTRNLHEACFGIRGLRSLKKLRGTVCWRTQGYGRLTSGLEKGLFGDVEAACCRAFTEKNMPKSVYARTHVDE